MTAFNSSAVSNVLEKRVLVINVHPFVSGITRVCIVFLVRWVAGWDVHSSIAAIVASVLVGVMTMRMVFVLMGPLVERDDG